MRLLLLLCSTAFFAACGAEARPDYRSPERSYAQVFAPEAESSEEDAAYVRGLLADDPKRAIITDARVLDGELLGIVVRPEVEGQALREVSLQFAREMARRKGGRDVEVIAYDEATKQAVAHALYLAESGDIPYESLR